jgi:hypothetical protein
MAEKRETPEMDGVESPSLREVERQSHAAVDVGQSLRPDHGAPDPVQAFARRHALSEDQARRVLSEHGADETAWDETARSLIHFLKAPS